MTTDTQKVLQQGLTKAVRGIAILLGTYLVSGVVSNGVGAIVSDPTVHMAVRLVLSVLLLLIMVFVIGLYVWGTWLVVKGYQLIGRYFEQPQVGRAMKRWFVFLWSTLLFWIFYAVIYAILRALAGEEAVLDLTDPGLAFGVAIVIVGFGFSAWYFYRANLELARLLQSKAISVASQLYWGSFIIGLVIGIIVSIVFRGDLAQVSLFVQRTYPVLTFLGLASLTIIGVALYWFKKRLA